jgi:hypothetical protein
MLLVNNLKNEFPEDLAFVIRPGVDALEFKISIFQRGNCVDDFIQ